MAGGPLDLEFRVELPPGWSEDSLRERLENQAAQLRDLLVADYNVVPETHRSDRGAGALPDHARASSLPHAGGYHPAQHEVDRGLAGRISPERGRGRMQQATPAGSADVRWDHLNHATPPIGPAFLRDGSYWSQRSGSRIRERNMMQDQARREREEQPPPPFRARPVPASVTTPLYQGIRRSRSADEPRRGRRVEGVSEDQRNSSEEHAPWHVHTRVERQELREASEERAPPFRARPVPWCVSAPLYDQMLIEDQSRRQQNVNALSRSKMRQSSLPPRLEAVRKRLCGDYGDIYSNASACGYRSNTPVPERHIAKGPPPESRIVNRPLKAELPKGLPRNSQGRAAATAAGVGVAIDAAETLSRDVAAGRSPGGLQRGYGMGKLHGSSYGISHVARHKTPPRVRGHSADRAPNRPFNTTEVPDFAALHAKQRQDRMRYQNRMATQPEPFVLSVPARSQRKPPPAKDPSKDPRFHRRPRSARRPQSAPHAAAVFAAGADGGSPSLRALERPPVTGPPRTTAKTLQAQQAVAERLMERRVRKVQEEEHIEKVRKVDPEFRARVRAAVGPVETVDEVVERQVMQKKQTQRSTMKDKHRDLNDIAQRVNRRPLLMQQTDSVARARRLALFQFRGFLKDAGVANPDAHFQDDELDELDRARAETAAAGG